MAGKIAELKFEAPLARFEEEDTASLKNMNLLTGAEHHDLPFLSFISSRFIAPPVASLQICVNLVLGQSLFRCSRIGNISLLRADFVKRQSPRTCRVTRETENRYSLDNPRFTLIFGTIDFELLRK